MKCKWLKLSAGLLLALIMLLCSFGIGREQFLSAYDQAQIHTFGDSVENQSLDSSARHIAGIPDSALSPESRDTALIKTGSLREESAESVVFLLGIFVIVVIFRFLLDGRPWSAVCSICMGFVERTMHQIQILLLFDGKSKRVLSFLVK